MKKENKKWLIAVAQFVIILAVICCAIWSVKFAFDVDGATALLIVFAISMTFGIIHENNMAKKNNG